ncbi:hypothetical protein [Rhizobium leguminosarum]|nr:hypothetical protein [Rhizobium leguminosarum]
MPDMIDNSTNITAGLQEANNWTITRRLIKTDNGWQGMWTGIERR